MQKSDVIFTHENGELPIQCPKCQSRNIETRNIAKRTGGNLGTAAGAVAGVAGVMSGAEVGATAGFVAGPVGVAVGGIIGALIGGIFGAAAGGAVGSNLGKVIDDTLLENYHCQACDHSFGQYDI